MAGRWPIARPWPAVPTPLAEVLRRNAYGGRPPADAEAVARLEAHVRHDADRLAGDGPERLDKVD